VTDPAAGAPVTKIALTGGIGSGKSTVARLLAERGALVVDADQVARDLVAPGRPALAQIIAEFGGGVVLPDGALDRSGLAAIVFGDEQRLAALNAIMLPRIAGETEAMLAQAPPGSVVVYDMPLLVEQGLQSGWDHVVVVEAPLPIRLARLARDRGMTDPEARARMAAQATDEQRRAVADTLIVNDGDLRELQDAVTALWQALATKAARLRQVREDLR